MRSNKKRNFFSFSRKGGICKAGMPKNHSIHDKAQAPPQKHLESWLSVKNRKIEHGKYMDLYGI